MPITKKYVKSWVQVELLAVDSNTPNYLTGSKQMSSGSFKNNITNKLFAH